MVNGDAWRIGGGIDETLQFWNVLLRGVVQRELPVIPQLQNRHGREALGH